MSYPYKRRRTATSVLAGDFDLRPHRDVLTSLLNGVPMPEPTEKDLQARRQKKLDRERKRDRRDRERRVREQAKADKKRVQAAAKAPIPLPVPSTSALPATAPPLVPKTASLSTSSFWQARPHIVIPLQRSASFSPPPMPSSPPTTPGPSISSRTSATSSKRPFTPDDDGDITDRQHSIESDDILGMDRKERKKRPAARKGWKGWVEGSPPPSEKLINLDVVTVLAERKTRSGKSFDAIGAGRDGWV